MIMILLKCSNPHTMLVVCGVAVASVAVASVAVAIVAVAIVAIVAVAPRFQEKQATGRRLPPPLPSP